ncbi:MAG: TrbC/VirB2 family protein [Patescibacteria group bacterium]
MLTKKLLRDKRMVLGIMLGAIIFSIALFGRMTGNYLTAAVDLNLGGVLGGLGVDVSTGGFNFSTGGGSAVQPGCGGGNCLVVPNAGVYSGIVGATSIRDAIIKWTNFFLGFLTLIAMIILIYAGFMYITAAGSDDQAKKAKNTIIWVVIGIIIIMLAYAFVNTFITTGPTGRDY